MILPFKWCSGVDGKTIRLSNSLLKTDIVSIYIH